jgi:hypothetical protein
MQDDVQVSSKAMPAIRQIRTLAGQLGCVRDRMQNIQFSAARVARPGEQAAEHSGGSRVVIIWASGYVP